MEKTKVRAGLRSIISNGLNFLAEPRLVFVQYFSDEIKEETFGRTQKPLDTDTVLSAGVSVENLLNRKNVLDRYHRVDAGQAVESVTSCGLGTTPNLSVKLLL